MKLQWQQYPIPCYFHNTWMFSCCTKSKLIHFRSHIFYFRWGKHRKLKNITFCVPQQCSSPSVSKSLSWQHDWPWKYYFPNSKNFKKNFHSKSAIFEKFTQSTKFSKWNDFPKLAAFSSEKMISYFWWICSRSTACISFDMSWSVVTTCSNTIWKQRIIREELWWEWNTRIICLKKLVFRVLLERFLFWLVLSIRKCKIFGRHMAKIICWAKCQLSAIKRP